MTTDILTALLVNAAVFSVLFGLMLIVRRLLGKRLSPVLQLALWIVVVLKLLIPFGFESDYGLLAAPRTVAAAPADTSNSAHIQLPAVRDNIAFDGAQTNSAVASSAKSPHDAIPASSDITQQTNTAKPVDWVAVLRGLWAAGALAVIVVQGVSAVNIRRRIAHTRMQTPANVIQVFEDCKAMLGIKRHVAVQVQSAFGMPVMMGVVKSALVLPEDACHMDKEALRHIMVHELFHLKRGDLLLIAGLNLLNAVYWFNPLTWLCFKLIRDDIETACDHNVFAAIGSAKRLDYIDTVLRFAGKTQDHRLSAAMGLCRKRAVMEKRISGMFKAASTGIGGRCAAMCIALLMLFVSVLTACQPTPEKAVVVQRDALEEKIVETAETVEPKTTYQAPDHWTDHAEEGAIIINVDADVILPDVDAYPVIKLEPLVLPQERVDELVHYFARDRKLYQPNLLTKKDYEDALIQAKRGQLVDGEYVVTEDTKRVVAELEETIKNAPEDSPKIYSDTTLTYDTNEDGTIDMSTSNNYLTVDIEGDNGPDSGCIYFRNYVDGESNLTEFSYLTTTYMAESFARSFVEDDQRMQEEYDPELVAKDTSFLESMKSNEERYQKLMSAEISITKDEAQAIAQKAIDELGIQNMYLITAERALMNPYHGLPSDGSDKGGYVFEYVRQSGGIAGFIRRSWSGNPSENPPEYRPPFEQESVTVVVTDDGIESFLWRGCAQPIETVSENVEMLPFEDVIERLKERIFIERAYEAGFDTTQTITINVDTAELRVGYIDVKDELSQALLVPVWMFQTTGALTVNDGRTFSSMMDEIYIFNAIDGGYIHESFG